MCSISYLVPHSPDVKPEEVRGVEVVGVRRQLHQVGLLRPHDVELPANQRCARGHVTVAVL